MPQADIAANVIDRIFSFLDSYIRSVFFFVFLLLLAGSLAGDVEEDEKYGDEAQNVEYELE
jgi:hypothetical protein